MRLYYFIGYQWFINYMHFCDKKSRSKIWSVYKSVLPLHRFTKQLRFGKCVRGVAQSGYDDLLIVGTFLILLNLVLPKHR